MFLILTVISFLKDEQYRDLLLTSIIILIIGTFAYSYLEGWSYVDSLYFSVVTLTTIGYGDFTPQTDAGKLFTILYIVLGIGMILSFVNTVHHHFTFMKEKEKEKKNKSKNYTSKKKNQ